MENTAEIKPVIRMGIGEIGYVSQTWQDPMLRNLLAAT
jgi:hypothetical protein